jgi:hypothetical protein
VAPARETATSVPRTVVDKLGKTLGKTDCQPTITWQM